jgi:hypothetical protein
MNILGPILVMVSLYLSERYSRPMNQVGGGKKALMVILIVIVIGGAIAFVVLKGSPSISSSPPGGDPCNPNPCKNGTCTAIKDGTYNCKCPGSFSGTNCEIPKNTKVTADIVKSGKVDVEDLLALLAQYRGTGTADIVKDKSGKVNVEDLLALLAQYGNTS